MLCNSDHPCSRTHVLVTCPRLHDARLAAWKQAAMKLASVFGSAQRALEVIMECSMLPGEPAPDDAAPDDTFLLLAASAGLFIPTVLDTAIRRELAEVDERLAKCKLALKNARFLTVTTCLEAGLSVWNSFVTASRAGI